MKSDPSRDEPGCTACPGPRRTLTGFLRGEAGMTAISSRRVPARDFELGFPALPGWMMTTDLAGLDDRALLSIVGALPPGGERRAAACGLLVTRYHWLVRSC